MTYPRGGMTLKTGKIGRVNCLRQQILKPGERMNIDMQGQVKLETLRERDSLRINAHLGVFMTPIRWLWPEFPDYIKEGPDTALAIPTETTSRFDKFGIGSFSNGGALTLPKFWKDACLRVYNEWYRWPEDPDVTDWASQGEIAVPLQNTWNRCRYEATPTDAADYTPAVLDVRDIAEAQARYRTAMDREILSYGRYMEIMKEVWNADGSREVDQVPIMLDQVEVGVNPRDMPAQDAAGLGEWQSIFDFGVDHQIRGVVAPEHCIITYMLVVRFAPLIESRHPMATDRLDWATLVGDDEILGSLRPQEVQVRDIATTDLATSLGYLPAGWHWRSQSDVIGETIDTRDSFPHMNMPSTPQNAKDATRVKDAFRSQALDDYVVDVYFHEDCRSMMSTAMESYKAGMAGSGNKSEFPKQGKML